MSVSLLLFLFALWLNMDASSSQTEIKCSITSIDNGEITGGLQDYNENEILHYRCNRRYKKQTEIPTKCLKVGLRAEFSPAPVCEPTTCKLPLRALEGTRYDTSKTVFSPDDTVSVSCGNRYWISTPQSTSAVSTCTDSGDWDITPVCQEVRCPNQRGPNVWEWNTRWNQVITLGDTVEYTCRGGYYPQYNTARCTREGWDPNPLCKGLTCNREEVQNADIVRNDKLIYEYDERVRYSCKNGYEGDFTLTCKGNRWIGNPVCREKSCERISINGAYSTHNDRAMYGPHKQVRFTCENDLRRQFTVTCRRGNWTGVESCLAKNRCGVPPSIPNAEVSVQDLRGRQLAHITCKEGYQTRVDRLLCQEGSWHLEGSSPEAVCTPDPRQCKPPPKVDNAVIETAFQEEYLPDSEVVYRCRDKYKLNGEGRIRCIDGEWEQSIITCTSTTCKLPLTALEGTRYGTSKTVFSPDDTVSVTCGNRYWISTPQSTSAVSTCTDSGDWDITPVCQEVRCPNQRGPNVSYWNAEWNQVITLGDTVEYTCRGGYYATTDVARCTREGWDPNPLCNEHFSPPSPA